MMPTLLSMMALDAEETMSHNVALEEATPMETLKNFAEGAKSFDDEMNTLIEDELKGILQEYYSEIGYAPEFQNANIDELLSMIEASDTPLEVITKVDELKNGLEEEIYHEQKKRNRRGLGFGF